MLPRIIDDLEGGFSTATVERAGWIVTAYLLGYTIVLPLIGRVADLHGHRRTYNLAIGIFAAGSLLCAVSTSLYAMVGFRALQAIGGGALVPIAMAVVGHSFPPHRRALALGVIGAVGEAGSVLGPLYGTVVGQYVGWRAIFYLNLPLTLVIVWLVRRHLSQSPRYPANIDYRSGALLALALGSMTAGISGSGEMGWLTFGAPMLSLSFISFVVFLIADRRAAQPLIDLSMFARRAYASANVAHFLLGIALITALAQVPSFAYGSAWPESLDSSPMIGGALLIRLTLMIPAGALLGGLLCSKTGSRIPAVIGFAVSALGLWQMSRWTVDVESLNQTVDLLITGFGFGLVIAPIGLVAVTVIKKSRMASGSAVLTATRIVGMTVGLAALNSWGINKFRATMAGSPPPLPRFGVGLTQYIEELKIWEQHNVEVMMGILSDFFLIAAAACLVAIIPSLLLERRRRDAGL